MLINERSCGVERQIPRQPLPGSGDGQRQLDRAREEWSPTEGAAGIADAIPAGLLGAVKGGMGVVEHDAAG